MKAVLFVVAVVVLLWLLRSTLRGRRPPAPPPASNRAAEDAKPMLTCAHCGMHLPRDEALPGRGGVFCEASHRAAFEKAHPDT